MPDIAASRLTYRSLEENDWPFFLALHQQRDLMHYISEARTEEEIRLHAFEKRLHPWHKGSEHWLCLVISEKKQHVASRPDGVY